MNLHERIAAEHAWRAGPGIVEGADIERAVLGAPAKRATDSTEYLPYDNAIAYARERKGNPLEQTRYIKKLRKLIAARCGNTQYALKFVSAVNTPLDTYHGVDGFFELVDPETKKTKAIVTLDVSAREKEHIKADVLLHAKMDDEGAIVISEEEYVRVANRVAQLIDLRAAVAVHTQKKKR